MLHKPKALPDLLVIFLIFVIAYIALTVAMDSLWCLEQWGIHPNAITCVYRESSLIGQYITPEGF